MEKYKHKYQLIIFTILILTYDIAIIYNIPFLRIILGIAIIFLPGILIMNYLFPKLGMVKKYIFSVGLSISFIIFLNLFINFLIPIIGYDKPLSELPSVLYNSTVLLIIGILIYIKKNILIYNNKQNILLDYNDIIVILTSISLILVSILSVLLVNLFSYNKLLILLILSIPIYCYLILRYRFNLAVYIITIFSISLTLAIIDPLRGPYPLAGGDGPTELNVIYTTLRNSYWAVTIGDSPIMATLSTGILIPVIHSITGIKIESIYRFLGPLLMTLVPTGLFLVNAKHFGINKSFLMSLLIIAQYSFINNIGSRIQIAWFFIGLMMILFLDIDFKNGKKILILIFLFSMVVSYYTYSYLFTFVLVMSFIILFIYSNKYDLLNDKKFFRTLAIVSLISTFLWWSQITNIHFYTTLSFFQNFIASFSNIAKVEARDNLGQKALGTGLQNMAEIINAIVFYLTSVLSLIGVSKILHDVYKNKMKIPFFYLAIIISNILIWISAVIVPAVSVNFGIDRAYYFGIPALASTIVIGASSLKLPKFNSENWLGIIIILLIIIGHLMISLGITYQIFGSHHSVLINNDGLQYDSWYTHKQEVIATNWLLSLHHNEDDFKIHGDAYLDLRFTFSDKRFRPNIFGDFFLNNKTTEDYIFLRYQNVKNKNITPGFIRKIKESYIPLANYSYLFNYKKLIYDNGGSEIYK